MSAEETKIRELDSAYKPFPSFTEWSNKSFVDPIRWGRYKAMLLERKNGLSPAVFDKARKIVTRAAALDTGAIEDLYTVDRGFTISVAQEVTAWETLMSNKGENIRPLFEAQLEAYQYVLTMATQNEPISEAAIRALHEQITAAQTTYRVATAAGIQEQVLPKGEYKALPNHVRTRKGTDHAYAPVDMTPPEMARFVRELRSEDFLKAHPVMQAAYAHYAFVVIHPFADGNGRVARALASVFTYRDLSIPIIILVEHKVSYLNALESADGGKYQAFIDFMLARALDTINVVDESILTALAPTADEISAAINNLYVTKGGYSHEQVDVVGSKLLQDIANAINEKFAEFKNPKINAAAAVVPMGLPLPNGYRQLISGGNGIRIDVVSTAPARGQVTRNYGLFLPKDAAGDDDVLVQLVSTQKDGFRARMDELVPSVSGMLQIHLRMFVERVVHEMLNQLVNQAKAQLGR